ncbi:MULTISPECIES: PH domain-containing protein [unclassified Modestobacter]|uniref:PH domain-containing protein n=1 Tax=unclassified Modestobacter TaxID=2643866 RepID=UPI0022AA21F6|nr:MULTISPECIES: PH domain-containing protein [unclassified Modestobacter]MCZ2823835.1 PH domain-containing protein [Modestobacter sp. VKM Ac-2981]MCZ2852080.1 PH domain-containing protein [Modestobacter sp. VKM Ac-2982]
MSGPRSRRPRWGKDAEKYLLPDEPPVIATRRHPAVLARPALRGVPAFAVGVWFLQLDPDDGFSTVVGLVVVLGALLYLGLHVGEWWVRHFLITRRRVLMTSGVFIRTVAVMPLRRITDLTWKETGWGQVLGYGTFRFESAGQAQGLDEITYLPHANALYKRLSELMFGTDFSTNPVSSDEDAEGSMNADDRGAEAAPEQHMPPPLQSGRRHDTAPIRRTRPPS